MGCVNVVIYDLATLELRWGERRETVRLYSADGVLLSALEVAPGERARETAFRAADDALARARVPLPAGPGRARVGLYNPFTGQVSLGATPHTAVYGADRPLVVPASGLAAVAAEGALVLGDGTRVPAAHTSWRDLTRRVAAHEV